MNIAILNLCSPEPSLDQFGTVGSQIQSWLSPHLPEATLTELEIATGTPLPRPADYDGYIVSGSEKGVYDLTDWMEPLKQFLLSAKDQHIPLFGICFGHQMMAQVFGGQAEKADKGFVVGACEFTEGKHKFTAHSMHRDQVCMAPPAATVTATATYCPIAALDYDFPARSVQFHPEHSEAFVLQAIDFFENNLLTSGQARQSRESLKATVEQSLCGAETAAFFKQHIPSSG